jgi:tetratricopeptide (TPR) repeat protein
MGKFTEAEHHCLSFSSLLLRMLGEQHPYTVTSYLHLADVYQAMERFSDAEVWARKGLAAGGEDRPSSVQAFSALSRACLAMQRRDEAESFARKALSAAETFHLALDDCKALLEPFAKDSDKP